MKNRHCLVCGLLLLRDLQTLGDGLNYGLSLAAKNCLTLILGHRLSYVCRLHLALRHGLSLSLGHSLNGALLRHGLSDTHGLRRTLHRLGLSLGHSLGRTLICGSGYIGRSWHALGHRLVSGKAGLFLPLLSLAFKSSLMLYSLNDCRIS